MVLPDFLAIGAQRCGTTLLHGILGAHPEIYVPRRRKEVHFFDRHFDRGVAWYQNFFPAPEEARAFRAIGEVTPDYIFEPAVPERIAGVLPDCRLIVSLRHPVRRVFSGYLHHLRGFNEKRPFEQFVAEQHDATARGFYREQLQRFFEHFPRERFLILIFEEWVSDPERHLAEVATFLGLSRSWPEPAALLKRNVDGTQVPYFATLFYQARRFGQMLSRNDLDWIVNLVKGVNIRAVFGTRHDVPPMTQGVRERLEALYRPEIEELERLLGREIPAWR
jgi:hypothetical protein